jgi:hypothetical protein
MLDKVARTVSVLICADLHPSEEVYGVRRQPARHLPFAAVKASF